jgi:hypothetical protein
MKVSTLWLCAAVWVCSTSTQSQDIRLLVEPSDGVIRITHGTETGRDYTLLVSEDLVGWLETGPAQTGDGQQATHEIATTAARCTFFRLRVTESTPDLAPTEAEATELFVGTTLGDGYTFSSSSRFHWLGEWGDWSYAKTGSDTALIVFTYDEDDNNPAVYREEVRLTFSTPTSGTYRYSEFYGGTERSSSVSHGSFNL